jgi:transposase
MNATTFGLDLAKRVMQVHWVETATGEICRRQLKRAARCWSSSPGVRRR